MGDKKDREERIRAIKDMGFEQVMRHNKLYWYRAYDGQKIQDNLLHQLKGYNEVRDYIRAFHGGDR